MQHETHKTEKTQNIRMSFLYAEHSKSHRCPHNSTSVSPRSCCVCTYAPAEGHATPFPQTTRRRELSRTVQLPLGEAHPSQE